MLKKYYVKSDTVPAYTAALLLDPKKRIAYLTKNWPEEWISGILKNVEGLWHEKYESNHNEPTKACSIAMNSVLRNHEYYHGLKLSAIGLKSYKFKTRMILRALSMNQP